MTYIPAAVLSVLELFTGPLAAERFGDVNAEALARLAANVESAGGGVANAEAKLAEQRQLLATEQEALLALAQRALAYARVYAETHDELTAELSGISLGRPAKPRKAPGKPSEPQGPLPSEPFATSTEGNAAVAPVEAREVELDAEANEVEGRAPSARKPRRSRHSPADAQSADEGARASE